MGREESDLLERFKKPKPIDLFKKSLRSMGAEPRLQFFKEETLAEMPIGDVWKERWDGAEFIRASLRKDGKVDIRVYLNQEGWFPMSTLRGLVLSREELEIFVKLVNNLSEGIARVERAGKSEISGQ
jgi:hypothetical protein